MKYESVFNWLYNSYYSRYTLVVVKAKGDRLKQNESELILLRVRLSLISFITKNDNYNRS